MPQVLTRRTILQLLPILPVLPAVAAQPPVDVVLLIQDSPDIRTLARDTDLRGLITGDRAALVGFMGKAHVKQPFTDDKQLIAKALAGPHPVHLGPSIRGSSHAHLWEALADAARLFDGPADPLRRRAVIVLFSQEDESPKGAYDDARRVLLKAGVSVSATGMAKEEPITNVSERGAQTPPTLPSRYPPITMKHGLPPEVTLEALRKLAAETRGSVTQGEWDLSKLLEQIRSR